MRSTISSNWTGPVPSFSSTRIDCSLGGPAATAQHERLEQYSFPLAVFAMGSGDTPCVRHCLSTRPAPHVPSARQKLVVSWATPQQPTRHLDFGRRRFHQEIVPLLVATRHMSDLCFQLDELPIVFLFDGN